MQLAVKDLIKDWLKTDVSFTAAGLTFYALFALVPLISLLITLSTIFINDGFIAVEVNRYVDSIFSPDVANRISQLIASLVNADYSITLSIGGVVALLYGSTSYFARLNEKVRQIFRLHRPDNVYVDNIARRVAGLLYSLFLFLLIATLSLLQTVINQLDIFLNGYVSSLVFDFVLEPAVLIVAFIMVAGLLSVFYRSVAKITLPKTKLIATSLVLVIAIYILNLVFSRALSFSASFQDYGLFSATLSVVVWLYLFNQLILIGALIISQFCDEMPSNLEQESPALPGNSH